MGKFNCKIKRGLGMGDVYGGLKYFGFLLVGVASGKCGFTTLRNSI